MGTCSAVPGGVGALRLCIVQDRLLLGLLVLYIVQVSGSRLRLLPELLASGVLGARQAQNALRLKSPHHTQ